MAEYYYAFLDEEGVVTNVLLFKELLPEDLKDVFLGPQNAVDCVLQTEETHPAHIGGDMLDGKFRPARPVDAIEWNEELWMWDMPTVEGNLPEE